MALTFQLLRNLMYAADLDLSKSWKGSEAAGKGTFKDVSVAIGPGIKGAQSDVEASNFLSEEPLLVPVLSTKQRVFVLAFFALFTVAFVHIVHGIFFERDQPWGLMTLLMSIHVIKAYGYDHYLLYASALVSRKINPAIPPPALTRVAMIATKCPAEPWDMLVQTLEGMLNQDYAEPYDVWIADEKPTEESLKWCQEHGVRVSSRNGVSEYHQKCWPRRTRSKEGNLSYFYDNWGYEMYDVVAQFDADHVPAPNYLRTVLPAFADEKAGRGRMHQEAMHHGLFGGGQNGFVPIMIGSHYVVRTDALKAIGGVGPELDEDFSTSMNMQAGGWEGVFSMDTIAYGDGPISFEDAVRQEYQWARSLLNLTLLWFPKVAGNMPLHKALRLLYCQSYFVYESLVFIFCTLVPILGALLGPEIAPRGLLITFDLLYRLLVVDFLYMSFTWWCRSMGHHRPIDSFCLFWEGSLFRLTRSFWMLKGVFDSLVSYFSGGEVFQFRVTPKGALNDLPMGVSALAPFHCVTAASAAAALATPAATIYHFLLLMNAVQYSLFGLVVTGLHVAENWNGKLKTAGYIGRLLAAQLPLAAFVAAAAYLKGGDASRLAYALLVVTDFNDLGTRITLLLFSISLALVGASLAFGQNSDSHDTCKKRVDITAVFRHLLGRLFTGI